MGIGDWGLGPIPNPQSPIPNPPYNKNIITEKWQKIAITQVTKLKKGEKKFKILKQIHFLFIFL